MIYNSETGKISVLVREIVNIARRGVSSVCTEDSSIPHKDKLTERIVKSLGIENPSGERLTLPFSLQNYDFLLNAQIDFFDTGVPSFVFAVERSPDKPSKSIIAISRAYAFISIYAYMKIKGIEASPFKIYYCLDTDGRYSAREEILTLSRAEKFFNRCTVSLSVYARPEIDRVTTRIPSMKSLSFPYGKMREGQSEFIKTAYRNIARGTVLFATAPTGTGKTVSALFPAVRALGDGRCDKVFYFTPKTTTGEAARDCLNLFCERGAEIRAVMLTAKEKLCKRGLLCRDDRDSCENSACKMLSDAVLYLYSLKKTVIDYTEIEDTAKRYTVCPHELMLTYSELCDVVILDINYLFDPDAYIKRFFTEGGRYAFLIDEAHNLPDRARDMLSASISEEDIIAPLLSDVISPLSETRRVAQEVSELFYSELYPFVKEDIRLDENGNKVAATHLSEIPTRLYGAFDTLIVTCEKEILNNVSAHDEEAPLRAKLLSEYLRTVKKFYSAQERFSSSYELFVFYENDIIRTKIFCVDPARDISRMLSKGHAAVFFSATLSPLYYYKSVLGGDTGAETLTIPSPFVREQLSVSIMNGISTRYSERERTLPAVLRAIAATVSARRGNYMVFLPSFEYAEMLHEAFKSKYPKIHSMCQKPNMSAKEKADFLLEFEKEDSSYLVAFAVMGGIYSEGIDLAGDKLIGAVVVGIGMPSLSYEREAISAYYQEKFEEGKQFAYVYPGMNRVLQAAGRVIRREDDRGVIVLIDDRFNDPLYKKIVPKLWDGMQFIGDAKELKDEIEAFWREADKK